MASLRGVTSTFHQVRRTPPRSPMPIPSIISPATDRTNLFAVEVQAKITKPDTQRMAEELSTAFEAKGTVDILIMITSYRDAFELGAADQLARLTNLGISFTPPGQDWTASPSS
ncbi:STAS/SEC14 domain-containing protein [Aquibium carbonis]|uniref:STAS/SEC14 domain-containing protein n=1 Tax=Aquibium carbonis TaxID=2495581 RepID=A0A3S0A313_9HYPH|nr:STAS/SEC14 domain-containing protein [Aquibium carbonis]RST87708.1 STAS/SEC14 domain-containing protein [Aquibium carbonis]